MIAFETMSAERIHHAISKDGGFSATFHPEMTPILTMPAGRRVVPPYIRALAHFIHSVESLKTHD